jgi:obg-like ATPase 1
MPPKNAATSEPKPLLGRPSNNLKIGIVGLPNVGKSSFFNALTNSAARAENFPFCTIDPEESRVAVPDTRFDWLCDTFKPASKVPAYLTVIDIAGLVRGASAGLGLGNAFLSHIRAVDGIFHMVRAFSDESVTHVEGEVDPLRDIEIINEELRLKDVEFVKKAIEQQRKLCRANDKDKARLAELELMERLEKLLEQEKRHVRFGEWTAKDIELINQYQLLTAKPVIYLVNISEEEYVLKRNKWLGKIKQAIDANDTLIPFSCSLENRLSAMSSAEQKDYLADLTKSSNIQAVAASALPKIIVSGYTCLHLIYYFTAGADEVRAWTIRTGTRAPQAAGVIHTDFERGFIMAEVMHFGDLREAGGEVAAKAAGKYYQKGKEYVVEDGDVIFFKFNAAGGSKKK